MKQGIASRSVNRVLDRAGFPRARYDLKLGWWGGYLSDPLGLVVVRVHWFGTDEDRAPALERMGRALASEGYVVEWTQNAARQDALDVTSAERP